MDKQPPCQNPECRAARAKARREKQHLRDLTDAVLVFLHYLDIEMETNTERPHYQRVANLANSLELANDSARFAGLGMDFRDDDKKGKPKQRAAAIKRLTRPATPTPP